ncbi:MAG: M1 family metallopeptidase [Flavobacteriia bacterium]|nr:M1 family metallopeptidase [Flavobacteriia bacterium]
MKYSLLFFLLLSFGLNAQILNSKSEFSRQDSLRGSNTEYRDWWDVLRYDITVEPDFDSKSIKGSTRIAFKVIKESENQILQIDLQQPMEIVKTSFTDGKVKSIEREGNVYFLTFDKKLKPGSRYILELAFAGKPKIAVRAPWDGGWIFTKDQEDRQWMTVACQGLGASVWFPNKDYQGDEPDMGASVTMIVDKDQVGVSNGRLVEKKETGNKVSYKWEVKNPINNYNITPYIGHYIEINDIYKGEKGNLDVDYWVLDYNKEKAEKQFVQAKDMLKALEYWFGPYPFYEDSYKLVEAPHLGMEHQSGVAYGNNFENGYLGTDLSESGWGLKWDFIIVHESGHEWFGNNITSNDVADMWVHEGFTAYSETLFTEQMFGKEAADDYVIGTRKRIVNDRPIIGVYGVQKEGSSDMYYKGANMIHTLRQWINDDQKFREILRGLNFEFYHQTVTTQQIEDYIAKKSGLDLTAFFDQYLRTTQIPIFEYTIDGNKISYQWSNTVEGFNMPVRISDSDVWLQPTSELKTETLKKGLEKNFKIDRNFYVKTLKLK